MIRRLLGRVLDAPVDEKMTRTYRAFRREEVNRRMTLDAALLAREGWRVDSDPKYTHLLNWAAVVRYRRPHRTT